MKTLKIMAVAAVALVAVSCYTSPKVNPQPKEIPSSIVDSASYAIGVSVGTMIKMNNMGDMNLAKIVKGYKDALNGKEGADMNFVNATLDDFMNKKMAIMAESNKVNGKKFLEKNGKKNGVVTLESGVQYEIVRNGNGVKPTSQRDTVEINYEGKTIDGKVFDSSYERGEPASFPLEGVIPGFSEGIMNIDEEGEINIYIPSELAYGEMGGMIGPNQTLIFRVELIKVHPSSEPEPDEE